MEALAQKVGLKFKTEKKFRLEYAEYQAYPHSLFLIRPLTYMNESGSAVVAFAHFFKIKTEEMLIAHDELDFLPGTVRLKKGGGHGGHNGLRDIMAKLNSADFYRLRFGIGHPGNRDQVVGFVLQNPRLEERIEIDHAILRAIDVMTDLLAGQVSKAMESLNKV